MRAFSCLAPLVLITALPTAMQKDVVTHETPASCTLGPGAPTISGSPTGDHVVPFHSSAKGGAVGWAGAPTAMQKLAFTQETALSTGSSPEGALVVAFGIGVQLVAATWAPGANVVSCGVEVTASASGADSTRRLQTQPNVKRPISRRMTSPLSYNPTSYTRRASATLRGGVPALNHGDRNLC